MGWDVKVLLRRIWAVSLAWPLVTVLATGGLGTACTETEYDTTIIEVERPAFNQPADSLNGFLGLYSVEDNQTVCGNCHADYQASWGLTAHAGAWETLQNSGAAEDFCAGCHSVSELGNALTDSAGYNLVQDSTYFNVQCESCHGPGLPHVESVQAGNVIRPFASIAVDTLGTNGCADCHEGTHHPFVEQWRESKHGFAGTAYIEEGGRAGCQDCHEGRKAIENNFGETADYVEKTAADYQPIVCATCHDPHDVTNEGQLRAPIDVPTRENLCVQCHSREGVPPASNTTRRGPHAAQGLLVIDEDVGYRPPNFEYDETKIVSSHGTEANPRLCASCHVYMFDVTDEATGDFLLRSVGHTFEAIQCLDAQGLPTAGPCPLEERQFAGCAVAGCHTSEEGARGAFVATVASMNFYVDLLWDDDGDTVMERTDGGILPDVLGQAIDAGDLNAINLYDGVLTPAEGAIWNAQLAYTSERTVWSSFSVLGQLSCNSTTTPACTTQGSSNTAHKSSGEGVHNPFLLEALLIASIDYLQDYYALPGPPVQLQPRLTPPPGLRVK
jgi:predicted CXXCH cytochrome family protein